MYDDNNIVISCCSWKLRVIGLLLHRMSMSNSDTFVPVALPVLGTSRRRDGILSLRQSSDLRLVPKIYDHCRKLDRHRQATNCLSGTYVYRFMNCFSR